MLLDTTVVEQPRMAPDLGSTTYLSYQDLTQSGKQQLAEVLRGLPGISVHKGGVGGFGNAYLRGASGYGLIQIDGIPVPFSITGGFNLDAFSAEAFESAKVVRGSSAMFYGSRALGGVIELSSRDAGESQASLHVEGGSFGTLRETAAASLTGETSRLNVTASRNDLFDGTYFADPLDGNGERDPFHGDLYTVHAKSRLGSNLDWDGSLIYSKTKMGGDGLGILPNGRIGLVDDLNGRLNHETWLAQNTAALQLGSHWESRLKLGFNQHYAYAFTNGAELGFLSHLYLVRWENSHRFAWQNADNGDYTFTWGGEGRYEDGNSLYTSAQGQRRTAAGFAKAEATWKDWYGVVGVQVDSYDQLGAHTLFHAGATWFALPQLSFHFGGGLGYRPPSFNEMLVPFYGTPNVKPEHGASGDIGLEWQPIDGTRLSLTGFLNRFDNLIQIERDLVGFYGTVNIPRTRMYGLETRWVTEWTKALSTGIDYTLSANENLDTGQQLSRHPSNIARFWSQFSLQPIPLTLWAEGIYRGQSIDGFDQLDDTFRVNLMANYAVNKQFSVYVRGENLTGNQTPEFVGWGVAGAGVYGGFRLSFQ